MKILLSFQGGYVSLENEFHEKCLYRKNYDWLENKKHSVKLFHMETN